MYLTIFYYNSLNFAAHKIARSGCQYSISIHEQNTAKIRNSNLSFFKLFKYTGDRSQKYRNP